MDPDVVVGEGHDLGVDHLVHAVPAAEIRDGARTTRTAAIGDELQQFIGRSGG